MGVYYYWEGLMVIDDEDGFIFRYVIILFNRNVYYIFSNFEIMNLNY